MDEFTDNTKKVLIISYPFPPHGGSGVIRVTKFVKYLPQFGWTPYVLTVKDSFYEKDETLLDEISDKCKIIRTYHIDPRYVTRRKIHLQNRANDPKGNNFSSHLKSLFRKFIIPDPTISWLPQAILKGFNIIMKEKIDLIYSISTPNSNQLIAYVLKRLTGKFWIADFKDPWTRAFSYKIVYPFSILDKYFEKIVINSCDRCIAVADFIKEDFSKKISSKKNDKLYIISNGFDDEDFVNAKPQSSENQKNSCLKITYAGSLYPEMSPISFFESISELIDEGKINLKELKLIFVGSIDNRSMNNPTFKKLKGSGILEFHGFVSHKKSVEYMLESDILLLIIDKISDSRFIPTSKIFEYLASNKPIMALTPPNSVAAELIKNTKSGYIVGFNDKIAVKKSILEMLDKFKNNKLAVVQNKKNLMKYNRKFLTKKLARIFDSAIIAR